MRMITLVENTPGAEGCIFEHGLSIYVEVGKHKILLDTGAGEAFLKNALVLGIDIKAVDMLILSHGHYDHAGGIPDFVKVNPEASIYMRREALLEYYSLKENGVKYIGVNSRICELPQVVFTGEKEVVNEEVSLFSGVKGRRLWPKGNEQLKRLVDGVLEQDLFDHEQSLVIRDQGKNILLCGCAHNGILNILDTYQELYHNVPDYVITGFHMKKNGPLSEEEKALVQETAKELKTYQNTTFYSGHCTGEEAFGIMKKILGDQLKALHSGEIIF